MRLGGSRSAVDRSKNWQSIIAPLTDDESEELAPITVEDDFCLDKLNEAIPTELLHQVHSIFNTNEDAVLGNKEELIIYVGGGTLLIDIVHVSLNNDGERDYEYNTRGGFGEVSLLGAARALEEYLKMGAPYRASQSLWRTGLINRAKCIS